MRHATRESMKGVCMVKEDSASVSNIRNWNPILEDRPRDPTSLAAVVLRKMNATAHNGDACLTRCELMQIVPQQKFGCLHTQELGNRSGNHHDR